MESEFEVVANFDLGKMLPEQSAPPYTYFLIAIQCGNGDTTLP